jgi:hypothetical protein
MSSSNKIENRAGYVLVSMIGPIFAIVAVVTLVVWLVLQGWEAYPDVIQTVLKVVGGLAAISFVGAGAWDAWKNRGKSRGF